MTESIEEIIRDIECPVCEQIGEFEDYDVSLDGSVELECICGHTFTYEGSVIDG